MTNDIDRAIACGADFTQSDVKGDIQFWFTFTLEQLSAYTDAVIEKCARLCEERAGTMSMFPSVRDAESHNRVVRGCAAAIRALKETK